MPIKVNSKKGNPEKLIYTNCFAGGRSPVVRPQRDNLTYPMILIRFTFLIYNCFTKYLVKREK